MIAIIGSRALELMRPGLLGRVPVDVDGVGTFDAVNDLFRTQRGRFASVMPSGGGKKMVGIPAGKRHPMDVLAGPWEFEVAWSDSTGAALLDIIKEDPETERHPVLPSVVVPSLDVLYTIKLSHRYLRNSPHFHKTMEDIRKMRAAGAVVPERCRDWLKAREKATYNYAHPNLNQDKKGFFSGDMIQYVYDHDNIHEVVALGERPAYTYFKKDDSQVAVDRAKWDLLPESVKLASVVEESYVLALERSQIPHPGVLTAFQSFQVALGKVCTSITSGWWREYAWEHYNEALALYDDTYVARFWDAVKHGQVKAHQP